MVLHQAVRDVSMYRNIRRVKRGNSQGLQPTLGATPTTIAALRVELRQWCPGGSRMEIGE